MELHDLLELYDQDQRRDLIDPLYRREVDGGVVRAVPLMPGRLGFVTYSHLGESDVEDAIQSQVDYFTSLGVNFEWKHYDHDTPPDLKDRLRRRGFEIEESEAILVCELDTPPTSLLQPLPILDAPPAEASGLHIQQIRDPRALGPLVELEEAIWETKMDWLYDHLGLYLRDYPDLLSVYLAYIDSVPACAAWVFYQSSSQFASLWGGSTLPQFRQRGLYKSLLAVRMQEAMRRGFRFLMVDASPMSQPILKKFGFRLLDYSTPCNWKVQK